jgi:predicted aminopeptidase
MPSKPASPGFSSRAGRLGATLLGLSALGLSGCGTVKYLVQATRGQLSFINRARPIPEVVADPRTPPRIKRLLAGIDGIKRFGEESGLKPTRNYTEYVHLDRPAAVWVVSACEPLQFKSKEWGFPIVGRFPYLGWFDREDARQFADELKRESEGWDVDLRGAAAYSTLGWFRDAVLSTMIPGGPEARGELVNVILHESVHATVYVAGQAFFNESIASFVADRLTLEFLGREKGAAGEAELKAYVDQEALGRVRVEKLHAAYGELNALYESARPRDDKLAEKARVLAKLKADLKYSRDINNATLVQFKTYNDGSADFARLLDACGKQWPRFWTAVLGLKPESFAKAQQDDLKPVLEAAARRACGG